MADLTITNLVQTCRACPSQWQGCLSDGSVFYARYRHGWGSAGVGDTLGAAIGAAMGWGHDPIATWVGDGDGFCSEAEMLDAVREQSGITRAAPPEANDG